jgi:hypothetical protein
LTCYHQQHGLNIKFTSARFAFDVDENTLKVDGLAFRVIEDPPCGFLEDIPIYFVALVVHCPLIKHREEILNH